MACALCRDGHKIISAVKLSAMKSDLSANSQVDRIDGRPRCAALARSSRTARLTPLAVVLAILSGAAAYADIGYQFVTVGNPGNAADTTGYGAVGYTFEMGTYDVTLTQYAAFLNAVANSDPYGLYLVYMGTDLHIAGISRNGGAGNYSYSVIGDGQLPATYITWFDAARFANWMNNGQPLGLGEVAGSTEQGAYTLNGATSGIITKNGGALYWIPTEDEWYKAAYYDQTLNGGAGGYWTYATRSNTNPGNDATHPTLANQANYLGPGVYATTQSATYSDSQNYLTDVGAFTNSASYYGTFDQDGDVNNWNDAVINGNSRGIRGSSWAGQAYYMRSNGRTSLDPALATSIYGFRLASAVSAPEPGATAGMLLGGALLISLRVRRRGRAVPATR